MDNVLIVSHIEKNTELIANTLKRIPCEKISIAKSCGEARLLSFDYDFDLYIIYSPVDNNSGEDLAKELITQGISQVMMIVKNESYDYISNKVEDSGVITISRPINKETLWMSIKLAKASFNRLKNMQKINTKLTKKIEDIKIIDKAKHVLISQLSMNEEEAHKYIEKKAMDARASKRAVAETILKSYKS